LVEGVRGGKADPGNYRRIQNYVANSSTGEVIYTPPSAVEVPIMMSEMVTWLNVDRKIANTGDISLNFNQNTPYKPVVLAFGDNI
jgi:Fic family protein